MNLISDKEGWIPVIRASGKKDKIVPWQIAEPDDPVIEIDAPRPDFQGALYQFLIGLIQTCFAPAEHDEWLEYWEQMPDSEKLKARFESSSPAFELDSPVRQSAFMQDLELADGEMKDIASLLIEAPGGKTIRDNLDHFIKRNTVKNMCLPCAATALFTLQTNAPSGGVGHRVGLRGGGPLTTLVMPTGESTLWQKLWINVLDSENYVRSIDKPSADVFPWMAETRLSHKGGWETRPENVHLLQAYWGMPRRIRLVISNDIGTCDICHTQEAKVISKYKTRNYGVNYVGEWIHPLTPYRFDTDKEKPPLSIKGQLGGIGYRDWLGYVLAESKKECASKNTNSYVGHKAIDIGEQRQARLWCFGYDMNKMKALCWYEHMLPLFRLDQNQRNNILAWASELISAAKEVANKLQFQIKAAWFSDPGEIKGTIGTIVQEFWEQSEGDFYKLLERFSILPGDQRMAPAALYAIWVKRLQSLAYRLFDEWVLDAPAEDLNMKRIIKSKKDLSKALWDGKEMKTLIAKAEMGKEVKNAGNKAVSLP